MQVEQQAQQKEKQQTQSTEPTNPVTCIQVAVPVPLHQVFDYGLPSHLQQQELIGCRVLVPFGRQKLAGIILSTHESSFEKSKIRPIYEVLDHTPLLQKHLLDLAQWCSDYYFSPLGEVLSAMLPTTLRQGKPLERYAHQNWALTDLGSLVALETLEKKSQPQAKVISLLRNHSHLSQAFLLSLGIKRKTLEALLKSRLITSSLTQRQPASTLLACVPPALTEEQHAALDRIQTMQGPHVLFGVTGSGKTEVYMRVIHQTLEARKKVLVLVPEIGLTPQTLARFQKRFPVTIAVLHSQQTDAQRAQNWSLAHQGEARLIIGTRSAIFAPCPQLGLIIVDEEHDQSYKQQDGMRYCARDLGLLRARWLNIPIILGSATPSLETLYNVQHKQFALHTIHQRATGVALPELKLVDLRREPSVQGIAQPILQTMKNTLSKGQQALVFLNRRGFAPAVVCNDCGWTATCHRCDAKLTLHKARGQLKCHHCECHGPIPQACPMCQSEHLNPHGKGTERVEDTLRAEFKEEVIRVDRDTMPNQKAFQKCLNRINTGEPLILLGTQMLSKGHDFSGVQLVVILDIDAGLFSSDFRAEEKISQLLTQVTGRAGRGHTQGLVMVQTFQPHHQIFHCWHGHNYTKTADYLLEQRRQTHLPPFTYHMLLRAESANPSHGQLFLREAQECLLQTLRQAELDVLVLGPVNATMERRAGVHRYQLLLQSSSRRDLHQLMRHCHPLLFAIPAQRKVRWSLDVDPLDF